MADFLPTSLLYISILLVCLSLSLSLSLVESVNFVKGSTKDRTWKGKKKKKPPGAAKTAAEILLGHVPLPFLLCSPYCRRGLIPLITLSVFMIPLFLLCQGEFIVMRPSYFRIVVGRAINED